MLKKILNTLFVIFIYRLCLQISSPGIDFSMLESDETSGSKFNLLKFLSKISGATQGSIMYLGISPYIMTSIVTQLSFLFFENLKNYKQNNPVLTNQITRILSLFFALFQLWIGGRIHLPFESTIDQCNFIISIMTGSMMAMWFSEKISEQKLGNGTSILIYTIIIASIPQIFLNLFNKVDTGIITMPSAIIEIIFFIICLIAVIFVELSIRKIFVIHSSQSNRDSKDNFIPIKINPSGILPIIFTKMFLGGIVAYFINFVSKYFEQVSILSYYLSPNQIYYVLLEISILSFMTYSFTSVIFEGKVIASNLQKQNTYIRGIKPGKNTENYLNFVVNNINIISIIYISTVVILLPFFLIPNLMHDSIFQGTSMLILVSVVVDVISHVQHNQIDVKYHKIKQKIKFVH